MGFVNYPRRILQRLWSFLIAFFRGKKASTATIAAPQPTTIHKISKREERKIRRNAISHPLRAWHFGTFRPIRPVGRGPNRKHIRFGASTRAFKDAFYHEFGVRLK